MKNMLKTLAIGAIVTAGFAAPAMAYPYHGGGYGGWHGGYGGGYVVYAGPAYYGPAYYAPYYYPPYPYPAPSPYAYAPPPGYAVAPEQVVITPQVVENVPGNNYCREYTAHAKINGVEQPTHGTACRQPDGSWKLMN